jgi:hypothetical protein
MRRETDVTLAVAEKAFQARQGILPMHYRQRRQPGILHQQMIAVALLDRFGIRTTNAILAGDDVERDILMEILLVLLEV